MASIGPAQLCGSDAALWIVVGIDELEIQWKHPSSDREVRA